MTFSFEICVIMFFVVGSLPLDFKAEIESHVFWPEGDFHYTEMFFSLDPSRWIHKDFISAHFLCSEIRALCLCVIVVFVVFPLLLFSVVL